MGRAATLRGEPVAEVVRAAVVERCRELQAAGVTPTLATVVASDDPADEQFVDLKHAAATELGVGSRDVRLDPDVAEADLVGAVETLGTEAAVHAIFVQAPLPDHIDPHAVRRAVDPLKDVDCFHPENVGRLVAGEPRYLPATPAAVLRLLDHYDVVTAGQDVAVVGRSPVIGRPLANLLWQKRAQGNATVTVCHSRTKHLAEKVQRADVVVTAAGQPGLVDGSMIADGATVIDVSATRVDRDGEVTYVGDVEFESAVEVADAVTPVPGGVGPVTIAMLLANVVVAAERQAGRSEDGDAWEPLSAGPVDSGGHDD